MRRIILASSSPRRQDLMKLLDIPFETVVSDFDELSIKAKSPRKFVEILSLRKAQVVAEKFKDAIVIGADTEVVLDGKTLGKPINKADAVKTLMRLSGTTHTIVTGMTIIDLKKKKTITLSVSSRVKMKKLTLAEIRGYIRTGEHSDKTGSYSATMKGSTFVDKITGDVSAIIGLPIRHLAEELRKLGVKVLN